MNERHIRWWTPHLSRDFDMLVFGNGGGLPLILFPTSFGRYDQNKDLRDDGSSPRFCRKREGHALLSGRDRSREFLQQSNPSCRSHPDSLGAYHNENVYFNSPYQYLPNMTDTWKFGHVNIILGTGEWDNTCTNRSSSPRFCRRKEFAIGSMTGSGAGHDWNYWRDMLPQYLATICG